MNQKMVNCFLSVQLTFLYQIWVWPEIELTIPSIKLTEPVIELTEPPAVPDIV